MSPFCLRLRLWRRAALPACSDGEVKGEGMRPTSESRRLDCAKLCQTKRRVL